MEFKFENFTKLFKNNKGIKEIDISVKSGEILGLIGDNGAGKSTLIKCIFEEYTRTTGNIYIDGEKMKTRELNLFSLFPDQSIFPHNITIYEFIKYTSRLSGMLKKEINQTVIKALESVNLLEYKNKTFRELSAGMQKRALLANAIITKPKIIFLDEPTANLDVKTRIQFIDILKSLANAGLAIVITSHLIDELSTIINKLVILDEGKLTYNDYINGNEENIKQLYSKFSKNSSGAIDVSKFIQE